MKKPLIYILLGLLLMLSLWGIVAKFSKQKPITRQDKINEINQRLQNAKDKIDSNVNTLPDDVIDSLYEVKRAENHR